MNQEFLTVSELNNFIRDVLSSGFPQAVWVTGEIQELKDKKHLYFTLSEKDKGSSEIIAKAGVIIWANTRLRIESILSRAENAFALKDGIEVKLLCKVDFYPAFGQVRLIAESIDPIYTLGKIAQDRQRLIAALKQKGVLDRNKRLALPRVPLNIGLVTSYDSAAYHDFIDEIKKSGFGFKVFVANALMQGKGAEASVVKALNVLNSMELDVLVITRGGGSVTELGCFDSEKIAVAIAESRLPVVSGIGHEINTTVTDLAAHTFVKTPTAVARFLIGRVEEFLLHLNEKQEDMVRRAQEYVKLEQRRLRDYATALVRTPTMLVKEPKRRLDHAREGLKKIIQLHLVNSRAKIENYRKLVGMADPKNTLKRGFSITRDSKGRTVRSIKGIKKGEVLTTLLQDGQVLSDVREAVKD